MGNSNGLSVVQWTVDTRKTHRSRIDKKIMESVEAQVKIEVGEWGRSASTKKFVEKLEDMVKDNDVLFRQARVKLDNS